MVIGKLVSHPCGSKAIARCGSCGRAMCRQHLPAGTCLQCQGRYVPSAAPLSISEGEMMTFDESEIAAFDQQGADVVPYHGDS